MLAVVAFLFAKYLPDEFKFDGDIREDSIEAISEPQSSNSVKLAMGAVNGKLCYPSEFIPKGKVALKNIESGEVYYWDYDGMQISDLTYDIQVPEGKYHVRFEAGEDFGIFGYFTKAVDGGLDVSQKDHSIVDVEVKGGFSVYDVDPCDYYYPDGAEPVF